MLPLTPPLPCNRQSSSLMLPVYFEIGDLEVSFCFCVWRREVRREEEGDEEEEEGGRLVIGTDCVLWLRRRVLLGRERGSIWAEF